MVKKIPQKRLLDFWEYFNNHKMKNALAQNLTWANVEGFTDNLKNPNLIMFLCRPWACYFAGNSNSENIEELFMKIPENAYIYVPSQEWETKIQSQWAHIEYFTRTELSAKDLSIQNAKRIINKYSLPTSYQMKKVDEIIANKIVTQKFANHWVGAIKFFGSPKKFVEEGIGFCILEGEKLCSIIMGFKASLPLTQSIEFDIMTHTDYRRRGFATLISARLIEYCLERGIEPHWDAANPTSVKLAQKLGYTDPEEYKCFQWRKSINH